MLCRWCDKPIEEEEEHIVIELYDTPWDNNGEVVYLHTTASDDNEACADCITSSYYTDFWYHFCDSCGRHICYRNPSNGWHIQFRDYEGEPMCLRCYMEMILREGQPRSDFEGDVIGGGMFFSRGNVEAKEAGYQEIATMHINDSVSARHYNAIAQEYLDKGYAVITAYERLAIGGLEGTVTLMAKQ